MKKAIKIMLIIWIVLALAFASVVVYGITRGWSGNAFSFQIGPKDTDYKVVSDESVSIDNVTMLDLEFGSQQVNIQPVEGNEFRIVHRSTKNLNDSEKIKLTVGGEYIRVRTPAHNFVFTFGVSWPDIVDVYVPEAYMAELNLTLRSGDLYISDLNFADGNIKTSSGRMDMRNLRFDRLAVNLSSGDMELSAIQSKTLDVQVSSGHLDSEGISCDSAVIKVQSGDVYSVIDCQNLDVSVSSGRASIDNKSVLQKLNAVVRSGDCDISIPDNDGFDLTYKVSSGMFSNGFDDHSSWEDRSGNWTYGQNAAGRQYSVEVSSGTLSLDRS